MAITYCQSSRISKLLGEPCCQFFRSNRSKNQEALKHGTAGTGEEFGLLDRFHVFDNQLESQRLRQSQHQFSNGTVVLIFRNAFKKAFIELQCRNREVAQIA